MSELIDAKKQRQEMLKSIIKDLHQGKNPEDVKEKFAALLRTVSPTEISKMEEQLIAEGMPEEEVKRLCEVHVAVFKEVLDAQPQPEQAPGHPLHTYKAENEAIGRVTASIREMLEQVRQDGSLDSYVGALNSQYELLQEIDKHYLRKENQLFPLLEKHDVTGPTKVMWKFHDDIRRMLKETKKHLRNRDINEFLAVNEAMLHEIDEMIYKEENILFPSALKFLSAEEWGQVRNGEEEIGFTLVQPGDQWQPPQPTGNSEHRQTGAITLSTGELTHEQLDLVLTHLPVDITYVDEHDRVRYYSQGPERIFPRSPAIIGRNVQNCHPADSVHVVEQIVTAFKNGEKSSAQFWLELNGRFIHIRYFAVKDRQGTYKGVVEVSQDITEIKQLQGQRRILSWQG